MKNFLYVNPFAKLLVFAFIAITVPAWGQLVLGTSPYTQNFDGVGSGLPTGWTVRTGASATSLGSPATFTTTATPWGTATGSFRNSASAKAPLTSSSDAPTQAASTDRCIGLRQTGSFGDPGAAITLEIANTTGKYSFSLTLTHMLLSDQSRTTTFTVQFTTDASGSSGWTNLGTYTTSTTWGGTTETYFLPASFDNVSNTVWIRIVALSSSTGSGARDTYGLDDVQLSWSTTPSATLSASPSTLSGFTYVVGGGPSASQNFTLTGTGLDGSNVTLTAPTNYEIKKNSDTTFGTSVVFSGYGTSLSEVINVRLKAGLSVGTYNGELITISGGGASSINVTCNGSVTAPSPPDIRVTDTDNDPIPINFKYPATANDTKFPSTALSSSSNRTYRIHNDGTGTLNISSVTIIGAAASQFSITTAPSSSVSPSSFTTFTVEFSPTSVGLKTARVRIISDDPDESPYDFNIEGFGTIAGQQAYINGLGQFVPKGSTTTTTANGTDFGSTAVTGGEIFRTFEFINYSGATINGLSVSVSGSGFSLESGPSDTSVSNGRSSYFTIKFDPVALGVSTGTVTVTNSSSVDTPYTFTIKGTGVNYTACGLAAPTTLKFQGFEPGDTWSYTQSGDAVVNITGGTFNNGTGSVNAYIGTTSYQVRSFGSTDNSFVQQIIEFAPVDVSAYQEVEFEARIGAFRTGSQGVDIGDQVVVEVSTDGGTTWSSEIILAGYNNSRWQFSGTTGVVQGFYTGANASYYKNTNPGNAELTGAAAPSTIRLKNLPSVTDLRIRVLFIVDRDSEIWALDDVSLKGRLPNSTTWNGSSWSSGTPVSNTKAIIDGNYNTGINGDIHACACEVKSGQTLTVPDGSFIKVETDFNNFGSINIETEGSLVQVFDGAVAPQNISLNKTISNRRYNASTFWSSPVQNAPFSVLTSANQYFIRKYISEDGSSGGWKNPVSDLGETTMEVGKLYSAREGQSINNPAPINTANITFTGNANNGLIEVPLGMGTANRANQYLGNPYPSAIYLNDFFNDNPNLEATAYLWRSNETYAGNQGYATYSAGDYLSYNLLGSTPPGFNGYVATGQGFVIKRNSGTTATFRNRQRVTGNNNQFYNEVDRFWLRLTKGVNNEVMNTILIGYKDGCTDGHDSGCDAEFTSLAPHRISVRMNDVNYVINGKGAFQLGDVIPLGYSASQSSNDTFKIELLQTDGLFSNTSQAIYLHDKALNIYHNLRNGAYTFTESSTLNNDRFEITYQDGGLSVEDPALSEGKIKVTLNQGDLVVQSFEGIKSLKVLDMTGRLMDVINGMEQTTLRIPFAHSSGVYILEIETINGSHTSKKILK